MLKSLKWDVLDFIHRHYLVLVGMIISFLLAVIPVRSNNFLSALFTDLSAGLAYILFAAGLILALNVCYRWLVRKSHLLELTTPLPAWKTLLGKVILAALVNLLACLFILQLSVLWGNDGRFVFLSGQNLKGIFGFVLFLMMVDCTITFSYILTMSFAGFRKKPTLTTSLLAALLLTGIISFCAIYMTTRGTLILPTISRQNILTISGSLMIFSTVFPTFFTLAVILLEFLGSSYLLGRSFERD
jgi:hypothetical protein